MTTVDLSRLELRYECINEVKTGSTTSLHVLLTSHDGTAPPHTWMNRGWSTSNGHDAVDLQVLKLASAQLLEWRQEGFEMPLCVPVSLESLSRQGAAERWLRAMRESGVRAPLIDFGITPVSGQRDETVTSNIAVLMKAGARFSLLGFGIGYSSLATLKVLPFSRLEVCEEHVHGLEGNQDADAILRSTLDMARHLQLRTCTAGVHSSAVAEKVSELGTDEFRGSAGSAPMTGEQVLVRGLLKPARELGGGVLKSLLERLTRKTA